MKKEKDEKKEKERRLLKDAAGLCIWAVSVYVALSLLSHSPEDPSMNSTGSGTAVVNWGGVVGAYVSDGFLQGFGLSAFLLPLVGLWSGWRLLRNIEGSLLLLRWVGIGVGLAALCALLSLGEASDVTVRISPATEGGGAVGYLLYMLFERYLGTGGSLVLLICILAISTLLATGIPLVRIAAGAGVFLLFWLKLPFRSIKAAVRMGRSMKPEPANRPAKKRPAAPEPQIFEPVQPPPPQPKMKQDAFAFADSNSGYRMPHLTLLDEPQVSGTQTDKESLQMNARIVEKKLQDFGVQGKISRVNPGPIVTLYEFEPAPGIKISRILNLQDDLAMVLRAMSVRIIAPIPGKGAVGIEIPNEHRETVYLKELLMSEVFQKPDHPLTFALGKDTAGGAVVSNLASMPHLLIAGATGAGKSVCLNAIITSILYKATPQEVKFLMIDPKRLELSLYRDIPHLLHPVVVEPKKAAAALAWAVREMERRYEWMEQVGVRNIDKYNAKMAKGGKKTPPKEEDEVNPNAPPERLPYIVLIIDELSDLMMVASRDVEDAVLRLAQMARASGIHLVVATQRPSVDVLTGTIKINLPVRVAFKVTSKFDSRTILDVQGAETLLGRGDMLFMPSGASNLQRIHGSYVSESEVMRVVDFIKKQADPEYDESVVMPSADGDETVSDEPMDEKYDEAVALVARLRQASISLVQRHLRIGYNRAARIIEQMETEGIVGPSDGSKPREVLVRSLDHM